MLKTVIEKLEDVIEAFRTHYVPKDGKFVLQLEGAPDGFVTKVVHDEQLGKLAEFRDNNRALNTSNTELTTKLKTFEGVDAAEYKTLKEKLKNSGVEGGDVSAVIAKAVEAAVKPLTEKLTSLETADKKKTIDLATETFKSSLKDAAIKAGVDEKMLPHFIDYALKTFQYVDGKFTPKAGEVPIYSKTKPAEIITPEEWSGLQVTEAPGFFKQSGGGGAGGNGGGGNGQRNRDGKLIVSTDPSDFGKNLEKIAKGEAVVQ